MSTVAQSRPARAAGLGALLLAAGVGARAAVNGAPDATAPVAAAQQADSCAALPVRVDAPRVLVDANAVSQSDPTFACFLWQTFVYLNWPARPGARGVPDSGARLGAPGPTVWETFASVDEVFRAGGRPPAPWDSGASAAAVARRRPPPRRLVFTSKVTPRLRAVARAATRMSVRAGGGAAAVGDDTAQVGGGVLVDQAGRVVYYELLLNRDEFDAIVRDRLYDADSQRVVARTRGIDLPRGPGLNGPTGAIEVKAAWRVLTPAETSARPVRFHTAQALLPGARTPVTVGLVGLHVIQRPAGPVEGLWATFAQVDNAPVFGSTAMRDTTRTFSFFDPRWCVRTQCTIQTVNQQTAPPRPTQVAQLAPPIPAVQAVNASVQALLARAAPNAPWQFYQLVGIQWSIDQTDSIGPGTQPPLPMGTVNRTVLLNPVLETFLQRTPQQSCLGCHRFAPAAAGTVGGDTAYAASYSFLLAHATSAPGRAAYRGTPKKRNE